ncbi:gephyrin-like molybdotransferase Glp [Phocicoccus pinnipedialis]|uniref:Molybdopterin molybdenumtransferase n=1 Tax=Phocicoccus pinnipedialis TaxID=110845 RepID=A0A6V7QZX9_9BACL|nr:gephyrin-like molybdotransferase Glp [Jeotgalicoccus pinnipedialis]MBP1938743.1 molybdopterin molybdotransferase [Jeotgalicoccus pinnipedialis]CAD2070600.1 Molybdopterin molybdenumtransferase [Jeotgalicoccus pinnipedialis]
MSLGRTPIHIHDAVNSVTKNVNVIDKETVQLSESHGRFIASDLVATMDVPIFTKSAMDGFAIRSEDSIEASRDNRVAFTVVVEVPAGSSSDYELKPFEAFRIMTGAEIPESADTVVMFEQTKETDDGFTIRRPFEKNENIAIQGEECKKGDVILTAGSYVNPGTVATLATFGISKVDVYKKPLVGILSTGNELLDVDDELERGKIRNSNTPMVAAQLERVGVDYTIYKLEKDELESLYNKVKVILEETDALITTGGVSVGDYDLLPAIYEQLGAEVLFNKVAMRPGSVTTVAKLGNKYLFGLSGNPSACYSGFELFVRPVMNLMTGSQRPFAPIIDATLAGDFTKPNPFTRFLRAELNFVNGVIEARPAGFNKSNAVTSIAESNGVVILPGGTRGFTTGDKVKVMLTDVVGGAVDFVVET